MVDQSGGVWFPAGIEKPTGVGFFVGGHLTNVPLFELYEIDAPKVSANLEHDQANGCQPDDAEGDESHREVKHA